MIRDFAMERILNFQHVHSLIQHREFKQANKFLEALLLIEPSESLWYFLKLFIASENRRGQEIETWHKKITTLFPGTIEAKIAESLLPGIKISIAIKSLEQALAMDINNPYINYLMGNYFRMDGDYLSAIRYYQRCLALDKEFFLAYPYRMHCFNQIGDIYSAVMDFDNILDNSLNLNIKILENQIMSTLRQAKK